LTNSWVNQQKEADDPSLAVNEDSDEASIDGTRVKRGIPKGAKGTKKPKARGYYMGCWCFFWYSGFFQPWGTGCRSQGNSGCSAYVWHNNHWRWCRSGNGNSRCYCNAFTKRVRCHAP
ncbi:hypothetical protein LSAT2_025437, partial [Lamellibrachia satsuma]